MNTEQLNRFDELMREKLGDFETEPEMELLFEIHARKNRFMRMRNLTKLIIGLAILSAGLLAGYYWNSKQAASHGETMPSKAAQEKTLSSTRFKSNHQESDATTSFGSENEKTAFNAKQDLNTSQTFMVSSVSSAPTSTSPLQANNKINHTAFIASTQDKFTQVGQVSKPVVASNKEQTSTNGDKDIKPELNPATACGAEIDFYTGYDNSFNFIPKDVSSNTKVSWLFGDGTSSNDNSPKHTYQKAGEYAVTLVAVNTKTNCKAEAHRLVRVSKGIDLSASVINGTVFADAEYAAKTRVDLLALNETTRKYEIVQTTYTNNRGAYQFDEVMAGNYLIKADGYRSYGSTYYGNTTDREYASGINVFANDFKELNGYDVQLVNNLVTYSNNPSNADTGSKWMLVVDQNNNPIASVLVGRGGVVQNTGGLPSGSYNLINPTTGGLEGNLTIGSGPNGHYTPIGRGGGDFSLGGGEDEGSAGVGAQAPTLNLIPNPAISYVKVQLNGGSNAPIEVVIMNSSGAIVRQFKFNAGFESNTIDINSLSAGTYYVIVRQNGVSTSSRLIKTEDK
jgi:PKD repeat protein